VADVSGGRTLVCQNCGWFIMLEYWDKDIAKCKNCNGKLILKGKNKMTNYHKEALRFATTYNLLTGNTYIIKKGKDYKHLKAVEPVVKDGNWQELFDKYFKWYDSNPYWEQVGKPADIGLLESKINEISIYQPVSKVENKGVFL
jgi:DNA-directed RNA polymerase subunit RPC12/RpoP